MARARQTRGLLKKTMRIVLAAALLASMGTAGLVRKAWGATTGMTNQTILIRYGSGNTMDTWNENVLTVGGKWAYCVQVDKHFKAGVSVTATDPVATGVWSQELCTKLALIDEFVQSGQFMSTGTLGKARHKVTDEVDKYAVAQCYIWKALDDAGFSDYDWFGVTVDGEGLTGRDTDAQINAYIKQRKDDYIGHASYYSCGSFQNVACDFSLEPAKGHVRLEKTSSNADLVANNGEYSLERAVYGIFEDEACTGDPVAQLTTDGAGKATSEPVRRGDYFVKETSASPGYELDQTVYPITVAANETVVVNAASGKVPETPQTGAIKLEKTSSIPETTDGNDCYANAGAVYGIYADKACETEIARMTTGEDGKAYAEGLSLGAKYVKELSAPEGMALDAAVHNVVVRAGRTAQVDGGCVSDVPKTCPVELLLSKYDAQLGNRPGGNIAQGAATLEGAQFYVEYYAGYYETAQEARDSKSPQRAWTFRTDGQGQLPFDSDHLVSGDALYRDSQGRPCLPLGTVIVTETKPPVGYLANEDAICIQVVDDGGNGESVDTYNAPLVPESVKRGDLELVKVGGADMERLAGIPLRITSQTTGESHVIATDRNGYASTSASWNPHTFQTNANDDVSWNEGESQQGGSRARNRDTSAEEGSSTDAAENAERTADETGEETTTDRNDGEPDQQDLQSEATAAGASGNPDELEGANDQKGSAGEAQEASPYDCEAGIWFGYAGEGQDAIQADDGLGALPFDTYTIEELPCPQNRGLQLVRASVVISKDRTVVDMGTIDDPMASLRTEAADASDGDGTIACSEGARIVDRVSYANLIPGREYTVNGMVVDKATSKAVVDDHGNAVSSSITFVPKDPNGKVEVAFDLSTLQFGGAQLVVFEELCEGDRVLASHDDLDDADQTLDVSNPAIGTSARDGADGDGIIASSGTATVVDTVSYSGLEPGREYTLEGSLVDGDTGEAVQAGGSPITAKTVFTPEASTGTAEVAFEFDASSFPAGTRLVAFERLATGGNVIAKHEDVDDEAQTVGVAEPDLQTTLSDGADGDKTAALSGEVELVDTVAYSGLAPGESYTVHGTLMDKASGKPLEDPGGNEITSQASFAPESPSGTVEVRFAFDASHCGDREVLAFETLEHAGSEMAVHADLDDESQTVRISRPRISTHATNSETKGKALAAESQAKVVDEVQIAGLQPGREYTLVGMMMDKQTGLPLLCGEADGQDAADSADADAAELAQLWTALLDSAELPAAGEEDNGGVAFGDATQVDYEAAGNALQEHSGLVERIPLQVAVIAPETGSIDLDVPFEFPTGGLSGQTVVFEALVENGTGKLVAVHADLDDEDQTLEIPQPASTSDDAGGSEPGGSYDKTGNWLDGRTWPYAFLAAAGCLLAAYGVARSGTARNADREEEALR